MQSFFESISVQDLMIVIGYFAVMIFIGVYFSSRMKNIREYFGGGGRVPWWLAGVSLYMSTFSAFGFVAYSELAYVHGLPLMTILWMMMIASLIVATFLASRWRRAARTSALEFIEERYGAVMRQGLAWFSIPLRVIDNGIKLYVIGTLIAGTLDLDPRYAGWIMLFSGVAIFVYTFLGGLWAVLVTDFVQAVIMMLAVAILLPLSLARAGGFEGLVEHVPGGFFQPVNEAFPVGYMIAWLTILTLNYATNWSLVQRFYSVPNDRDARKVGYCVAFLQLIAPPLLFLPAMAARVFMPEILDSGDTERVYALLCRELLPVGMIGLLIAAMFAATMSMLSSEYNAVASVMTNDVYRRMFAPDASEKRLLLVGRMTTLLVGLCCLGIAFLVLARKGDATLFEIMLKAFSVFLPPIALPMIAGLLTRRVSNGGALLGASFGMVVGLTAYILSISVESFAFLKSNQAMVPVTVLATLMGMFSGNMLAPSSIEQKRRIDAFLHRVDPRSPAPEEPRGEKAPRILPTAVIGWAIGLQGILVILVMLIAGGDSRRYISLTAGVLLTLIGAAFWLTERFQRARQEEAK